MASVSFSTYSFFIIMLFLLGRVSAELSNDENFYEARCPGALGIIKGEVINAVAKDRRIGASLLRLHFHDCFVNGCDASVLLENDPKTNFTGEQSAVPNANSLLGFEVIDEIKRKLENKCRGVVSCADILAVAARDSVDALRCFAKFEFFPFRTWNVELGRFDSKTASINDANRNLPPPFLDLKALIDFFARKGFSTREMVALSGGHTVGKARCTTFRNRIYNESNINRSFAENLRKTCPRTLQNGDNNLAPLDDRLSPNSKFDYFDNSYFKDLVDQKGLLHSDQQLYNITGGPTNSIVLQYSIDQNKFLTDFGNAMVKMGRMSPLTKQNGEIRRHCRRWN